jgi:hypothetical protein
MVTDTGEEKFTTKNTKVHEGKTAAAERTTTRPTSNNQQGFADALE